MTIIMNSHIRAADKPTHEESSESLISSSSLERMIWLSICATQQPKNIGNY